VAYGLGILVAVATVVLVLRLFGCIDRFSGRR
jgi:hypothetical protein